MSDSNKNTPKNGQFSFLALMEDDNNNNNNNTNTNSNNNNNISSGISLSKQQPPQWVQPIPPIPQNNSTPTPSPIPPKYPLSAPSRYPYPYPYHVTTPNTTPNAFSQSQISFQSFQQQQQQFKAMQAMANKGNGMYGANNGSNVNQISHQINSVNGPVENINPVSKLPFKKPVPGVRGPLGEQKTAAESIFGNKSVNISQPQMYYQQQQQQQQFQQNGQINISSQQQSQQQQQQQQQVRFEQNTSQQQLQQSSQNVQVVGSKSSGTKSSGGTQGGRGKEESRRDGDLTDVLTGTGVNLDEEEQNLLGGIAQEELRQDNVEEEFYLSKDSLMELIGMQAGLYNILEASPEVYKFCNLMVEAHVSRMLEGISRIARARQQPPQRIRNMVRTRDWRQQIMQIQKQEEKDAQERSQANKQQYLEMAKRARKMDELSKQQVEKLKKEQEQQKSLELANARLRGMASGGVKRKTGNASMDFIAMALGGGGLKNQKKQKKIEQNNPNIIPQNETSQQLNMEQKLPEEIQNSQQQNQTISQLNNSSIQLEGQQQQQLQSQQQKLGVDGGGDNLQLGGVARRGSSVGSQRGKQQKFKVQIQDVLSYYEHEHGVQFDAQRQLLLHAKIWEQQAQQQQ